MRLPRIGIRTLMTAVASAAIGLAASPRTHVHVVVPPVSLGEPIPLVSVPYSSVRIIATATFLGAAAFTVLTGFVPLGRRLISRMTARRWVVAAAVVGVPLGLCCRRQYLEGLAEYHGSLTVITLESEGWKDGR